MHGQSLEIAISIHAPSRERPQSPTLLLSTATIAIHAPSRERHNADTPVMANDLFQSTLPRGSDIILANVPRLNPLFQSTLPRGSDAGYNLFRSPTLEFQSTLPRGSDPSEPCTPRVILYFNPRSLAGATQIADQFSMQDIISIHAPSRERQGELMNPPFVQQFQSTLPRGSDKAEW